ncbi:MAG TPA: class I SAM-dependent methyltransferase [Candidatus Dormibacteraeota bacterium]
MSREHWEHESSNWATWARRPDFDAYWKYSAKFFELLPPPAGRTLEVGCGEGRVCRDLAKRGHRMAAVDVVQTLIRLAKDADEQSSYIRADAAALPFADESFDLVVFYNTLMDIDEMELSVLEAARVLRHGGALCACVTHPLADAGRYESADSDARFIIEGTYLGERRWLAIEIERGGARMNFAGWAYPLEGYFGAMERAGFVIQAVREPSANEDGDDKRWRGIPLFLMWRAVKP